MVTRPPRSHNFFYDLNRFPITSQTKLSDFCLNTIVNNLLPLRPPPVHLIIKPIKIRTTQVEFEVVCDLDPEVCLSIDDPDAVCSKLPIPLNLQRAVYDRRKNQTQAYTDTSAFLKRMKEVYEVCVARVIDEEYRDKIKIPRYTAEKQAYHSHPLAYITKIKKIKIDDSKMYPSIDFEFVKSTFNITVVNNYLHKFHPNFFTRSVIDFDHLHSECPVSVAVTDGKFFYKRKFQMDDIEYKEGLSDEEKTTIYLKFLNKIEHESENIYCSYHESWFGDGGKIMIMK